MAFSLNKKTTGLISGVISFLLIILFFDLEPGKPEVTMTLAVAVIMAIWWITEAVPLAVTALLPVVLFPFLGITSGREVSSSYFNHIIFLFLGGFIMALAMERWNLHKRIALKILIIMGVSPARILLGFMVSTAFLSMWISNTATTMMMIPIVLSVALKLGEIIGEKEVAKFSTGLFLGVAYSASIGGLATLVGSPTNLICPRVVQVMFPAAPDISFAKWFFFGFPVSITMFMIAWVVVYAFFKPNEKWPDLPKETFRNQYKELGKRSSEETIVLVLFIALALLWIGRSEIRTDGFHFPGWAGLFNHGSLVNDGTVAIAMAILLFIIPASKKGERIMNWETTKKLPWNIVLLFGGGFALALGFESSGLARWFGENMGWAGIFPPVVILFIIILLMSFLTELTSNVASTQMLLPAFAALAVGTGNNPLLFMIPVTLASSLAFMLPTATPSNAIIFGTQRVSIPQMARTGFVINLLGIIVVVFYTYLIGHGIFGIEPGILPDWATL